MVERSKSHLEWANAFTGLLKKHFGDRLVSIVLYGSVARGKERADSDIDLLLVIREISSGRFLRRRLMDPVYEEWDRLYQTQRPPFISTILKTPEEARRLSPIYFDMIDRSRLLVDQGGFFKGVLLDVQRRLERLGARRRRMGKVEYWDLKPDYKPGEVFEI